MMNPSRSKNIPVALVTGGARRLGAALVRHLVQEGWGVAIHYASSRTAAQRLADAITRQKGSAASFQMDFLNGDPGDLIPEVRRRFPGLKVLINNASLFERTPLDDCNAALFEKHWRINFLAPVLLSQAFRRHIKHGCIINILDTAVVTTRHSHAAYLLAKKNLLEFTRMAAAAWAPHIRVNAVCPGFVFPPENDPSFESAQRVKNIPLKRRVHPKEVAEAVLLLMSNPSITGEVIFVDGGEHIRIRSSI